MYTSVIIPAAGQGKRMKSKIKKQYMLLDNKPILAHTIEKFERSKEINSIIIVSNKDEIEYCSMEIVKKYAFNKVEAIIIGGEERHHSVYNGLTAIKKCTDIVLIHDGARPFVEEEEIIKSIYGAKKYGACCIGVKVKDTIKICDERSNVIDTPNRSRLWSVQTPQSFQHKIIKDAYNKAYKEKFIATDDSTIVEKFSHIKVKLIEGKYNNIKITTPEDLIIGEKLLKNVDK